MVHPPPATPAPLTPRLPAPCARDGPHTSHTRTHWPPWQVAPGTFPASSRPASARRRPVSTAADRASARLARTGRPQWRSTSLRWTLALHASRRSRRTLAAAAAALSLWPLLPPLWPLMPLWPLAQSRSRRSRSRPPACTRRRGVGGNSRHASWVWQVCLGAVCLGSALGLPLCSHPRLAPLACR